MLWRCFCEDIAFNFTVISSHMIYDLTVMTRPTSDEPILVLVFYLYLLKSGFIYKLTPFSRPTDLQAAAAAAILVPLPSAVPIHR